MPEIQRKCFLPQESLSLDARLDRETKANLSLQQALSFALSCLLESPAWEPSPEVFLPLVAASKLPSTNFMGILKTWEIGKKYWNKKPYFKSLLTHQIIMYLLELKSSVLWLETISKYTQ